MALYFAYGSNLLRERLLARCPNLTFVGLATLAAHRLTFDKVSSDGSGKCTFEPDDAGEVSGVLWEVLESELEDLDLAEGAGNGYERCRLTVLHADRKSEVLTYRATDFRPDLPPYDWYLALVVAGAKQQKLPEDYVKGLLATHFEVDPVINRRARRRALTALEDAGMMEVLYGLVS